MCSSSSRATAFLLRVAVFLLVFTALAEVWLRTVTPASEKPIHYQDARTQIFRFDPAGRPEGLATVGRLARRGGHWRVNNAGWISAVDYVAAAARQRPMVAIFGDSYIEGFLTDVDKHVDAYLSRMLTPATAVYAFGESGWYLEQYVATSRYATTRYQPDVLVIFVGSGDVVASVRQNGAVSANLWQVSEVGGHLTEVAPESIYVAGRKARLAGQSALIRYLRYNAKLALPGMQNAAIPEQAANSRAAGDAVPDSSDAWRKLLPAANYMVGRLCVEHPGVPIVFVARDARYLPVAAVNKTPLSADALSVQTACRRYPQCYFLDLRPAFSRDWAVHQQRFEAADGAHWNAHANHLVAQTLADFLVSHDLAKATLQIP